MKPLLLLLIAGLISPLFAEEEASPEPKAPFLAAVPDYGHWVVTFKYTPDTATAPVETDKAKPPAAPEGFPTSIDTIKTGDLRGVVLTFADGSTKQFTCQGEWVLASTSKGPQLSIATSTLPPYVYYTTGFVFLDGVTVGPTTYRGLAKHNGKRAFHYKSENVDVWIEPGTMLPLAAEQNGVEITYQFLPPPPRPFVVPKDQAELLQKQQEAYKKVRALR